MASQQTDTTNSPTPRVGMLGRLRRNRGDGQSTASSAASINADADAWPDDSSNKSRSNLTVEKAHSQRSLSIDERRGSVDNGARRLSALLSRRKKKPAESPDLSGSISLGSENGNLSLIDNRSQNSLLDARGSGHSSLFTDDNSDHDSRPPLTIRPSHAGYLTLSSPEIVAHTQDPTISTDNADSVSRTNSTVPQPAAIANGTGVVSSVNSTGPSINILAARDSHPDHTPTSSRESFAKSEGNLEGEVVSASIADDASVDTAIPSASSSSTATLRARPGGDQTRNKDQTRRRPKGINPSSGQPLSSLTLPSTPPNPGRAPATVVTPPTPTLLSDSFARVPDVLHGNSVHQQVEQSPRGAAAAESLKHRRGQSATFAGKISNSLFAPLTPPIEETKTPGGTLTQPAASGFFSSVFSVAQKAADQLTNSINLSAPALQKGEALAKSKVEGESDGTKAASLKGRHDTAGSSRASFSLNIFGTSDIRTGSPMNSTASLVPQGDNAQKAENGRRLEQEAAARAVSSAYQKAPSGATGRPASIISNEQIDFGGDQTPPRAANDTDIKRSASVRSTGAGGGRRRHRASSATAGTSNSIAAAIKDSGIGLVNPGLAHRQTGFAVASSKRNRDFHTLFRSVPEDDYLIEDYSAALQRDILLHGRLYVSEGHICFSSNILGWVTNLVIGFDELVSIEKKSTAVIFPNALVISTPHARNTFASFVARDSTYELLIGIWKNNHPNLKSSLNGVMLDNAGTGDKTELADPDDSDGESDEGSEDEVYDEDAEDDVGSYTDAGGGSAAPSEAGDTPVNRKVSGNPTPFPPLGSTTTLMKGIDNGDAAGGAAPATNDFPGVATHAPTECTDVADHYERPIVDTTIPAPLGKVYSMIFGPGSTPLMRKWLVDDQKSRELNYPEGGMDNDHKTFSYNYIKPLGGPVGPKQTKCITTCTLTHLDLDRSVSVDCSTQTPDVPNGNVFTVKTRYCLMWGPGNSTRMIATCTIEWTGKSWLRGVIDKASNDGQLEYVNSLIATVRAAVASKGPAKPGARKGRRKGKKDPSDADETAGQRHVTSVNDIKPPNWGVLEPIHPIVEPILGLVRPFITSQVVVAVLFVLLAYSWIFPPARFASPLNPSSSGPHVDRLAAYEELWQREESSLWDWLEDRVGLDAMPSSGYFDEGKQHVLAGPAASSAAAANAARIAMAKKLHGERMSERQMDSAIRTTEEKLGALKEAVKRRRGSGLAE